MTIYEQNEIQKGKTNKKKPKLKTYEKNGFFMHAFFIWSYQKFAQQ